MFTQTRHAIRLILPLLCIPYILSSQNLLEGKVIDDQSKESLSFAYVKLKDIAIGTVTDSDGRFQLNVPFQHNERAIVFSYVGYEDLLLSQEEFRTNKDGIFRLKPSTTTLQEVVITPKKLPKPRALLKKVFKRLADNYAIKPILINGYYRETLKENGAHIKFNDAVCSYYSLPYSNKKYKRKDYQSNFENPSGVIFSSFTYMGFELDLHRFHFHFQTLKEEAVNIHNARSSENLTKYRMNASIKGGPLSLFARNRVKYQDSFLGNKKFRDFTYILKEVQDDEGNWLYQLDFHTKTTKAKLDSLEHTLLNRQWRHANKHKLLKGKIYIDQNTYAIVKYECAVPNSLKGYFCGQEEMQIKHFDYKLDLNFKQKNGTYYLDYLRHENEFIYEDTIKNYKNFYAAISEFHTDSIQTQDVRRIPKKDNFANVDFNYLYDYALEYDSTYWTAYRLKNQYANIDTNIRTDMESKKVLEQQFRDKHVRDENMPAPIAPIETHTFRIHNEKYSDPYAWLKDTKSPKTNPQVMDYLLAENDYARNYTIPLRKGQRDIFEELVTSIRQQDTSLPTKDNGYYYYSKLEEDDEHPRYYRKKIDNNQPEELLLDVNKMADEYTYYTAGPGPVSPNNNILAYYENTTGKDSYTIKFKDLKTGQLLSDSLTNIASLVWLDNESFLYSLQEEKTLRTHQIMKHQLGSSRKDELVYEEKTPNFSVNIGKSLSKEFIFLSIESNTTSEIWYLPTKQPNSSFQLIRPREKNHLYSVSHYKDKFYIRSNKNAINYQLMTVDTNAIKKDDWQVLVPHKKSVLIGDFKIFDNYLVIRERENAENRIKVINRTTQAAHYIKFKEAYNTAYIGYNRETNTDSLEIVYTSFKTPITTYRYHMGDQGMTKIKQAPSPTYIGKIKVKRIWATSLDGQQIPITVVYDKWRSNGTKSSDKKLYLTSYGAYGSDQTPYYDARIKHLISTGFTVALAHVRGGNDMGEQWYEAGKLLQKKNTFYDFITCAEHLIQEGYAQKGSITAEGGSAGGLLMGAVANMRPDLFKTIILNVPFVDVINTMLDEKLPLTIDEYEEWGNPEKRKYYDYMKSYSPYDNVQAQNYPNLLFFTGLNDTRVGYWEAAKMVAKLRALKTDNNLLLLHTSLSAGHGGASGRFSSLNEQAYRLALIADMYNK